MRPLLALILLGATTASAEPVQLRKTGNPTVVTFEYITQDDLTITVQVPGKDAVISYKWEELDQDFIRKNNPSVWAEREILLKPAEEKKMTAKTEEVDPFAVEIPPTDAKSYLKNLQTALNVELKGLPIQNIPAVCREFDLDETAFWKGFDELRRLSKTGAKPEPGVRPLETTAATTDKAESAPKTKAGKAGAKGTARSADNLAREAEAKRDYEGEARPFTGLAYLRQLAEGGAKQKLSWIILRRASEDRNAIIATLKKYETVAQELSDKTTDRNIRGEALVLKKAVATVREDLEKVTRDNMAIEARLQSDCQTLLNRIFR